MSSCPSGACDVSVSRSCSCFIQAITPFVTPCSSLTGSQSNMQSYSMTYSNFGNSGVRNVSGGPAAGSARVTAVVVSKAKAVIAVAICIAAASADAPLRIDTCKQGEDVKRLQQYAGVATSASPRQLLEVSAAVTTVPRRRQMNVGLKSTNKVKIGDSQTLLS